MIDVILPVYLANRRLFHLAHECLISLELSYGDFRLIVIDNGSPNRQFEVLARNSPISCQYVWRGSPLGFPRAVNMGLKLLPARYEHVVILNNDTRLTDPAWALKLRAALTGRVGIAGPRTNARRSWQGRRAKPGPVQILAPGRVLAFFCVMLTRECVETVGLLDEDFGVGLGEDDDYCIRAQRAGFDIAFVPDAFVHHEHRATLHTIMSPQDVHQRQVAARELLRKKGRIE